MIDYQKAVRTYIVSTHNYEQEQKFKSGQPCLPTAANWEEYEALRDLLESVSKAVPAYADLSKAEPSTVIFDIPERYRR